MRQKTIRIGHSDDLTAYAASRLSQILLNTVHHDRLAGKYCVVVPLFEPVPREDRGKEMPTIRAVLNKFNEILKMKYRDTDVRWMHVGSYQSKHTLEKECILFDLADLDSVNGDESFIDEHMMTIFENRRADESVTQPKKMFRTLEHSNIHK